MKRLDHLFFALLGISAWVAAPVHADEGHSQEAVTEAQPSHASPKDLGCPFGIVKDLQNDSSNGIFSMVTGLNIKNDCVQILNKKSAPEIEKALSSNPVTKLEARGSDDISGGCANWIQSNQATPGKGGRGDWKPSQKLGDDDKKKMVMEYYLLMNRIKAGAQSNIKMMASIDRMLGKDPLQGENFSHATLPEIDKAKNEESKCRSHDEAGLQVLVDDVQRYVNMKNNLYWQQRSMGGRGATPMTAAQRQEKKKYIQGLQTALEEELEGLSWMGKDKLNSMITQMSAPSGRSARPANYASNIVRSSVISALQERRQELSKGMNDDLKSSLDCLNSKDTSDAYAAFHNCTAKVQKLMDSLPAFDYSALAKQKSKDSNELYSGMGAAECRNGLRDARNEINHQSTMFALNVALTVAGGWAGSVAKVASAAAKGAEGAAAGAEAANATASALRMATFVGEGSRAVNLANNAKSLVQTCGDYATHGQRAFAGGSGGEGGGSEGGSCGSVSLSEAKTISAYKDCMASMKVMAIAGLEPLAHYSNLVVEAEGAKKGTEALAKVGERTENANKVIEIVDSGDEGANLASKAEVLKKTAEIVEKFGEHGERVHGGMEAARGLVGGAQGN